MELGFNLAIFAGHNKNIHDLYDQVYLLSNNFSLRELCDVKFAITKLNNFRAHGWTGSIWVTEINTGAADRSHGVGPQKRSCRYGGKSG
jgi:hypothetical protein